MWTTLRAEMVHHIINGCDDILSLAKQIVPQVMDYENYALSIADIHDAVQPLKKANKGWKRSEVIDTSYSKPIPKELEGMPSPRPRENKWSFHLVFAFNPKKDLFKMEMWKYSHSPYNAIASYTGGRQVYTVLRKGTSMADLGSDTFLYKLRDVVGTYLAKIRRVPMCGQLVSSWSNTHKLLCGVSVSMKGAKCKHCRNKLLKRKFEEI